MRLSTVATVLAFLNVGKIVRIVGVSRAMKQIRFALASLLLCTLVPWVGPALAQSGGIASGRATEQDVANLNGDLVTLFRAQRLFQLMMQKNEKLKNMRQNQLRGLASDEELKELFGDARKWWQEHVADPALRIASNPAAPCAVGQVVLTELQGLERQAQLVGVDASGDVDINDSSSLIRRAIAAVQRRCLEEAYDACMLSGNGQHIAVMAASARRQFALLGIPDAEFESQAVYLFRRCTVYQLRYHSQDRIDNASFALGSTQDGSVILLSDVDPSKGVSGLTEEYEWKGPRDQDPSDLIATETECVSHREHVHFGCGQTALAHPARARIKASEFSMQRDFYEIQVSEDGKITETRKSEGKDTLTITYYSPIVMMFAMMSPPGMNLPVSAAKGTFEVAHRRGAVLEKELPIDSWSRGGHPTLFEKTFSGDQTYHGTRYIDTTKFELVHRPDLYPPEEIVPKWELTPSPEEPQQPRKPLPAKPAKPIN